MSSELVGGRWGREAFDLVWLGSTPPALPDRGKRIGQATERRLGPSLLSCLLPLGRKEKRIVIWKDEPMDGVRCVVEEEIRPGLGHFRLGWDA